MEPISNSDRVMALLRQKLEQRAKVAGSKKISGKEAPGIGPSAATGIRALAGIDDIDDRHIRRALIEHLLSEQLGSAFVNDAQFQQVVTRVTSAIEQDPECLELLTRAMLSIRHT